MIRYVYISFLIFTVLSCTDSKTETDTVLEHQFSVYLTFENDTDLENKYDELNAILHDTLVVKNKRTLLVGQFNNFRRASDKGFELYADGLIKEFKVFYKDSTYSHDYTSFYFVGHDLGRPALYFSELMNVKPQLTWSKWGREIINLHRSPNREHYFFTTCLVSGISGNFPYIRDARLYSIQTESNVELINIFGDGLNLTTGWESNSEFVTYFSKIDSLITSTIMQSVIRYNEIGESIDTSEQIFELVEDGIPVPRFSTIEQTSPNLRYKISTQSNDSVNVLNIVDEIDGSVNQITQFEGDIKEAKWNQASDFLFLRIDSKSQSDSTKLMSIDLKNLVVKDEFFSLGLMNFITIGNLLIYDKNFSSDSYITLYRYRVNKVYDTIKIPGGCGVDNLPVKKRFN